VLEPRPLDVRVGVVHLDLVRPGIVGGDDHGPGERLLAELGVQEHRLARGNVGTDADGELGEG